MLKMSTAAEKRGLDKTPAFDEKMRSARMQILSQELSNALQEDAGKVTDADIEDYYKKNEAVLRASHVGANFCSPRKANCTFSRDAKGRREGRDSLQRQCEPAPDGGTTKSR